jgi:GDSL-like Lipase/Acylhydrolase family
MPIITRASKGAPLTHAELDGNFNSIAPLVSTYGNPADAISVLGDSYGDNGFSAVSGTINSYLARGQANALNVVLGSPWATVNDRATTGTRSDEWVSTGLLASCLTDAARWVFVTFPTNDVTQGYTTAQITASLAGIYDALRQAGKLVIPATGGMVSSWSAGQLLIADAINEYIVGYARRYDWPVFHAKAAIADPATGKLTSTVAYDEGGSIYVHPDGRGNFAAAIYSLPEFEGRVRRRRVGLQRNNLLLNPRMAGSVAGVPTSWTLFSSAAGTPTSTKVARANGAVGEVARTVYTSASATGSAGLQQVVSLGANLAVGDIVQVFAEIKLSVTGGGALPRVYVNFGGSPTPYNTARGMQISGDLHPTLVGLTDGVMVVSSPPVPVPSGSTNITIIVAAQADSAAVVTFDVEAVELLNLSR